MKNYSLTEVVVFLVLFMAGCSNENLSPEIIESYDASHVKGPAILDHSAFMVGGILFDLESAPNDDILVANAMEGIFDVHGNVVATLPGVTSVSTVGRGVMWATTGPSGAPTEDTGQGLYLVKKNRTELVVNLFAFEEEHDPDGGEEPDSNPYSVLALNANSALVIDSGGNDLLHVDNKGNVEVMAVFPEELVSTEHLKNLAGCPDSGAPFCELPAMIPAEAVPTSVVLGPDGYYYVSELKGFPSPTGESNIWRVSPDASGAMCGSSPDCVKAFDGGFTSIIDLAFDKNGMLYVAELDENGWFAVEVFGQVTGGTIKACDPETMVCEVIATGIPLLTSITFDKKGRLWATKNALIPPQAEVVHLPL